MTPVHEYEQLHPRCCLSLTSIGWAASHVGPAFVYDLLVHPSMVIEARGLLKRFGTDTASNPLSPYINLIPTPTLAIEEWYLRANDKVVGSLGVR